MKPKSLVGFPERLSEIAFVNGEDVAWEQKDCAAAIEWLREANYALLGVELWIIKDSNIRTAIHTNSGAELYVSSCDPIKGETWRNYVERSAQDAVEHILAFVWPEDSLESPRPVHFNLSWADREWFRTRSEYASYFVDE
jgi:hypothetical protein